MKKKIIALYLPQFHPIPENDEWWGAGFTEWTNVSKAQALYKGHEQPKLPADLGFYDLRVTETREKQAQIAQEHGVAAFCYWHYWFGNGRRLLERPFMEVLSSGSPDFPFCLAWANESWRGFHHGLNNERVVLIEQTYPGEDDYIRHFQALLPAFKDKRYLKVNGKPLFMVYKPYELPNPSEFIGLWTKLAQDAGLTGMHFVAQTYDEKKVTELLALGFDAVNIVRMYDYASAKEMKWKLRYSNFCHKYFKRPRIVNYADAMKYFVGEREKESSVYPTIIPNWDHTPRTGRKGLVFHGSTPELFAKHLSQVGEVLAQKEQQAEQIVFLKSWNEWAEGNYMEPDLRYGYGYLEELKRFAEVKTNLDEQR